MLTRTEGIVLKSFPFGEADLIVTYLTRDYGLLSVFAKSPRKIKSRFGSSLEPLTYSKISFLGKEDANLPRLTQSDIIKAFHVLRDELKCFLSISEMLEMSIRFLPEKEPNFKAFKLLLNTLMRLESDCSNKLYYLYYKIRFLEITGYLPKFDACGRCGANGNGNRHFYVSHGSIMCKRCIDNREDSIIMTEGILKFYKSLLKWSLSNINRIRAPEYFISEVNNIINSHIAYIAGPQKSFNFIRMLT
ncbi:DNA repair protein RecO [Dissulfurispira thermophila]|uniref:DNA repair protein RecO n=1 Tax=Dissulfurispira thermophila TaxID=2715679 RepID=A0A7G1H3L9_9BACT|nr:DNA repair protein RecO [Dissulfurispira thermophila]BCB96713.1 DNA repair protein RecO [Dissulfurispira thermophila]